MHLSKRFRISSLSLLFKKTSQKILSHGPLDPYLLPKRCRRRWGAEADALSSRCGAQKEDNKGQEDKDKHGIGPNG